MLATSSPGCGAVPCDTTDAVRVLQTAKILVGSIRSPRAHTSPTVVGMRVASCTARETEVVGPGRGKFIVDDDVSVREVLVNLFAMEGYRTRELARGAQVWHAINGGARPAAIVLDLWLPDMSDREVIGQMRASAHRTVPVVVVVSGSAWSERLDCDADAAFRNPVEGSDLVRAVDRLVARSPASRTTARAVPSRARPVRRAT